MLETPLQPSCCIRSVNWLSYHNKVHQTLPSDSLAPITTMDDVDHLVTYLQDVVVSAMDRHTYLVLKINQRSQLPDKVLLTIHNLSLIHI